MFFRNVSTGIIERFAQPFSFFARITKTNESPTLGFVWLERARYRVAGVRYSGPRSASSLAVHVIGVPVPSTSSYVRGMGNL